MSDTTRGKFEKRADEWGPGTHRELLEFLDELACDADKDVEHWKRKARRLGEYAAKLRVLVGIAAADECTRGYCGDTPGCIWYFEHSPRRWCGPCRARAFLKRAS